MTVSKSYSSERFITMDYWWRLLNENPEWKLFSASFKKAFQPILFPKHILTLLHFVLIKIIPNMSHVDTKIQRLLIPFLLSE